ncbi:MAG TPA: FGGY family carbohydrate kinase, partial [Dehalococcoidia bacterium]|nr:FGGY family carbohydrate kinase [Dehalococcoidia bacterium]
MRFPAHQQHGPRPHSPRRRPGVVLARGAGVSAAAETVLAIDAGTTGVTAVLLDARGEIVSSGYQEIAQHYPRPGWVEQDPGEIWRAALGAAARALSAARDRVPVALGIANQRETCLFWDRRSGEPLHDAIVWQCRRSAPICEELRSRGLEDEIRKRTGLRLDPYFSGTKALWLVRNDASLATRIASGAVCFGTVDSWLAYRLSGNRLHVTDTTNASRTLAFDIDRLDWDDGLLELFGLRRAVMASARPSASNFGLTEGAAPIPDGLSIAALVGDQQAALYGQACFRPGMVKATYGTGCFVLAHTGSRPVHSPSGLLTTVAATADGSPAYATEGAIFIAGAALQWCRDNLGIVSSWQEAERMAASVPDSRGVVFVPAFAGLGSPRWAPDARGALFGLTGAT